MSNVLFKTACPWGNHCSDVFPPKISFPFSRISHKLNHTGYTLLLLTSFIQHSIILIHLCWWWWSFLVFSFFFVLLSVLVCSADITKCLGGEQNRNSLLTILEDGSPWSRYWPVWFSCCFSLWLVSGCLFTVSSYGLSLCMYIPGIFSSSYRDPSPTGLQPPLYDLFNFNCLFKGPISKYGHIRDSAYKLWGVTVQSITLNNIPLYECVTIYYPFFC